MAKIAVCQSGYIDVAAQHIKKVLATKNVTLESSGHNFRCASIVPSIDFIGDIPDGANETFYRG